MPGGKDKILGPQGTGTLDDSSKLTKSARDRFCAEVIGLLNTGNADGLGLSKINPLLVLPVPPIPGPPLPGLDGKTSPAFWFDPQPFANLAIPALLDPQGAYQTIILDKLYAPLVNVLNLNGDIPAAPVVDPTIFIDLSKFPRLTLGDIPGILAELSVLIPLSQIPPAIGPKLILKEDFGIGDLQIPDLLKIFASVPSIPNIGVSLPEIPIPEIPNPGFPPAFVLGDIALGLFSAPAIVIPQILGDITIDLDPLAILKKIIQIIIDIILKILQKIGILFGGIQLLAATLAVIIKNLAGMILCDAIGSLLGTGLMVKIVGNLVGLS